MISAENTLTFHLNLLEERGRRSRILACPDCIEVEDQFVPGESEFVLCEKHSKKENDVYPLMYTIEHLVK